MAVSKVAPGQRSKPLLARGVPDHQLDCFATNFDELLSELNADGVLLLVFEVVSEEAVEKAGLTDGRVAYDDDLEHDIILFLQFDLHFK